MHRYGFYIFVLLLAISACGGQNSASRESIEATVPETSSANLTSTALADEDRRVTSVVADATENSTSVSLRTPKETETTSATSFIIRVSPTTTTAAPKATPIEPTPTPKPTAPRTRDGKIAGPGYTSSASPLRPCLETSLVKNAPDYVFVQIASWNCFLRLDHIFDDSIWVQKIQAGTSREEVLRQIYNSEESLCLRGKAKCVVELPGHYPGLKCSFSSAQVAHENMKKRLLSLCPNVTAQVG